MVGKGIRRYSFPAVTLERQGYVPTLVHGNDHATIYHIKSLQFLLLPADKVQHLVHPKAD
jgi:hypothetical protein